MSPVPKGFERKYGLIVGHLINSGWSEADAKAKADEAAADYQKKTTPKKKKRK